MGYDNIDMVETKNGRVWFDLAKEQVLNKERNLFILFSGGLDSAVLVHRIGSILKEANSSKCVNLIVAKHDLHHSNFQRYSQRAIDDLLSLYKTQGLKVKTTYVETSVYLDCRRNTDRRERSVMSYPYQLTLANTVFTQDLQDTDLFMGIVAGDGLPAALDQFETYFYTGMKLLGYKNNKIYFPILRTRKAELIEYAKNFDFYDMTASCELPTSDLEDCGNCDSCISKEVAEMMWEKLYGVKEKKLDNLGCDKSEDMSTLEVESDNTVRDAITDVIPGYLDRILEQIKTTNPKSNDEVDALMVEISSIYKDELNRTKKEVCEPKDKELSDSSLSFVTLAIDAATGYEGSKTTMIIFNPQNGSILLKNDYETKGLNDIVSKIRSANEICIIRKILVLDVAFGLELIDMLRKEKFDVTPINRAQWRDINSGVINHKEDDKDGRK